MKKIGLNQLILIFKVSLSFFIADMQKEGKKLVDVNKLSSMFQKVIRLIISMLLSLSRMLIWKI